MVVNDKVVSQLCDEGGNLSQEEFEQAMRKQAMSFISNVTTTTTTKITLYFPLRMLSFAHAYDT